MGTVAGGGGSLSVGANGTGTAFTGSMTGAGDIEKIGTGSLTLTSANTYTGATTISAGTLVAGNDLAFGATTQAITFNGGGLASNNDARVIAYPIAVNPVSGSSIAGSNSMTLTGPVTNGGTGSMLDVNFTNNTQTHAQRETSRLRKSRRWHGACVCLWA